MINRIFLALCVFLLILKPVLAGTVAIPLPHHEVNYEIVKDKGLLEIYGRIDSDTAITTHEAFVDFKKEHVTVVVVHLNSLGGSLGAGAMVIEDMIDARNSGIHVITIVDHREICASMCTGIFAIGEVRMAAPDTFWVFHAPYLADKSLINDPEYVGAQQSAVKYLTSLYMLADPKWTTEVLVNHITEQKTDLILSGADIAKQSETYITKVLTD